jgi:hypothetical protein
MTKDRARWGDPLGFPRYHAVSFARLAKWIWQGIRHPQPATFRGLMTPGSLVHAIWWTFSDLGWSMAWRPYCWGRRFHSPHHCDVYFEMCTVCGKSLWSRSRHGSPNPYRGVDRVPLRHRPVVGAPERTR